MDALRNSDQSAAEGRLGFSKAISLIGEPAGLKLVFEEGVRGSLYRLLKYQSQEELLAYKALGFASQIRTTFLSSRQKFMLLSLSPSNIPHP